MTLPAEIHEAQQRIKPAYDPDLWQTLGRRLIDLLADHLRTVEAGQAKVLRWREPPENVAQAADWMARSPGLAASGEALADRFAQLVRTALERGLNLHDPRYIGHQVAASAPLAGLFDAVGSVTNQAMAIYDMGPWATAAERAMVQCLGRGHRLDRRPVRRTGDPRGLAGKPHGPADRPQRDPAGDAGSWAPPGRRRRRPWWSTPTPITACRGRRGSWAWARATWSAWGSTPAAAWTSGGWTRPRRLAGPGPPIVAVVACACSTPVGAFDPLEEVADVCRRHGVWLHVDAAHGGAAA